MRRRRAAVVASVLLAVAVVAALPAAAGEGISTVAWWTDNPLAQPRPEGGFEITADPSGPRAFAGLMLSATGDVSAASLRLQVESAIPAPDLRLCRIHEDFSTANPGSFEEAPATDCVASKPFSVDGDQLVVDVTNLVGADPVGVAVMPTEGAIAFHVVVSSAAVVVGPPPPPTGSPSPEPTPDPPSGSPAPSPEGAAEPVQSAPAPGTDAFARFAAAVPPPVPQATEVLPVDPDPASAAPLLDPGPGLTLDTPSTRAASSAEPARPWSRLIVLIPLSVGFGYGMALVRRLLAERGLLGRA